MTDTEHRQGAPRHRTPATIREETFPRRMLGGLDQEEVYAYLDELADQVQAGEQETERLRGELQRVQAELDDYEQVGDRVNEQVVELFSQAQLVAEQMVEDTSRDARERIGQARAHERKIVEDALDTAGQQVSSYARSAQEQMRAIVDSFATEVDRLGSRSAATEQDGGADDPLAGAWHDPQAPSHQGHRPGSPR